MWSRPRVFSMLLVACGSACGGSTRSLERPPIRLLQTEAPHVQPPEAVLPDAPEEAPRLGAPGGSGAGMRRVAPIQSGNDTVGGLPAGSGAGTARPGRG